MVTSTHVLAHRARLGMMNLHVAARRLVHQPVRLYSSRAAPGVSAAAAAAVAAGPVVQAAPPIPDLSFAGRPGIWDQEQKLQLKNLTIEELEEWCESMGHEPRKALLLWKAMYQDGRWIRTVDDADDAPTSTLAAAAAQVLSATAAAALARSVHRSVSDLQLPSALKASVQQHASLDGGLTLQSVTTARDGTHKLVFSLHGGSTSGSVETVLIPMTDRGGTRLRYTACLSSQVGCAMNCQFCYTGRMGLLGNLSTSQIVEQLVEARRWLAQHSSNQLITHLQQQQQQQEQQQESSAEMLPHDQQQQQQPGPADWPSAAAATLQQHTGSGGSSSSSRGPRQSWQGQLPRINNIVFMGMGEPLHNPAVWPALDILCHPSGLGLSRSKVIVSTVGLLPQLRALRASGKAKLAVSLHATTDEVRDWIVPTNRRYPLADLIGTLRELYPLPTSTAQPTPPTAAAATGSNHATAPAGNRSSSSSSSSSRERPRAQRSSSDDFVVIEYVLLKDVNDSDADAHRLLELLSDVYCMINLIVFNPHEGTAFEKTDEQQARRFKEILQQGGKVCTLRISKGDDEMAACGQLGGASMGLAQRPAPLLQPPASLRDSLPGAAAVAAAVAARQQHGLGGRARQVLLKKRGVCGPAVVPRV